MTQTLDDSAALLQLLSAPGAAVFLDFDGTLVDLAPTPDGVRLEPGVVEALALLAERHGGALALISGRPVAQIDAMLAPLVLPVAGVHGVERRGADGVLHVAVTPDVSPVLACAQALRLAAMLSRVSSASCSTASCSSRSSSDSRLMPDGRPSTGNHSLSPRRLRNPACTTSS